MQWYSQFDPLFQFRPMRATPSAIRIALQRTTVLVLNCGRPLRRSRLPPLVRCGHRHPRSPHPGASCRQSRKNSHRLPNHSLHCRRSGRWPNRPQHPCRKAQSSLRGTRGIRLIMLDGPQAWKSKSNGCAHARVSERQLNTAAKTGLPGMVKPGTYRPFAEFCLDVYEALCRRGWRRMDTDDRSVASSG
jgi:hypothetical protein